MDKMKNNIIFLIIPIFIGCATNSNTTSNSSIFRFNERYAVKIDIPETWRVQINGAETESGVGYTLTINTGNDVRFLGLITILAAAQLSEMTREQFWVLIQDESSIYASQSVEGKAIIESIDVNNGYGAYYILTDADLVGKTPGPNEYKIFARFVIRYNNGALALITALMDDTKCDEFAQFTESIVTMEPIHYEKNIVY
jgi:hypothetical protein